MNFFRKFSWLIVGGLLTAGVANAEEWRMATLAPEGSSWMKILDRASQEAAKATSDRVKFKYYSGGVQGDEKDVVRKMASGSLDGGALTTVGLAQIDESIKILELPMLYASEAELDYVRGKMWPTFEKRFLDKGYILGDQGDVGYLYLYTNNEIKSIADLAKAKIWMWAEDKLVKAIFTKMNLNGVPLGVPDVLPALQTGRIDATYASPLACTALQWHTKVKYATSMPMAYGVGATVIKKDAWDKLSEDDKKAITKLLVIQGKKIRTSVRKENALAAKAILRSGVKVVETPADMVAEFTKLSELVWKEQAGKLYSQADLDNLLKYRAEFRAGKR